MSPRCSYCAAGSRRAFRPASSSAASRSISPRWRRRAGAAFLVAFQSASQQVAVVVAALVGFALERNLGPAAIAAWGWRLPFALGCAIIPLLFWIRRSLAETEAFKAHRPPDLETAITTLLASWRIVLIGTLLVVMTTVSFYLITVYTPDLRAERAASRSRRDAAHRLRRRDHQLLPAAACRRAVGSGRPPAAADRLHAPDAGVGLSHAGLARGGAVDRPHAGGRAVAGLRVRGLQRGDGRGADRSGAGGGANGGLLARLQPRHRAVRRHDAGDQPGNLSGLPPTRRRRASG